MAHPVHFDILDELFNLGPGQSTLVCPIEVNAVKFRILQSSNGDDCPNGYTAQCGAEGVVVVDVLLHFEGLCNDASFEL